MYLLRYDQLLFILVMSVRFNGLMKIMSFDIYIVHICAQFCNFCAAVNYSDTCGVIRVIVSFLRFHIFC